MVDIYNEAAKIADQEAKQQQAQQAQQIEALVAARANEQNADTQKELAKIQADLTLRMAKEDNLHKVRMLKARRQLEMKQALNAQKIRGMILETQASIRR